MVPILKIKVVTGPTVLSIAKETNPAGQASSAGIGSNPDRSCSQIFLERDTVSNGLCFLAPPPPQDFSGGSVW